MPGGRNYDDSDGDTSPKPSLWLRFQNAIVKPDDAAADKRAKESEETRSLEEIEAESNSLSDKERAIGLIAAPIAALITFLVVPELVSHDVSHASTYHELLIVLLAMAVLAEVCALLRKRLFLGMVLAIFGLGLFNLHQWGFGVPFIMVGAWYLVRSYRLSQSVKLAKADGPRRPGAPRPKSTPRAQGTLPRPNKRYTPRTAPKRSPQPKP